MFWSSLKASKASCDLKDALKQVAEEADLVLLVRFLSSNSNSTCASSLLTTTSFSFRLLGFSAKKSNSTGTPSTLSETEFDGFTAGFAVGRVLESKLIPLVNFLKMSIAGVGTGNCPGLYSDI